MLAYKVKNRSAPTYLNALITLITSSVYYSLRTSADHLALLEWSHQLRVYGRLASSLFSVLVPR